MTTTDAQLADLVAAIVSVARHFQHPVIDDDRIVELSPLERIVVRHVYRYPGISPTTLASDLGLQASNASTAIRQLAERGFIARTPDPADRRSSRLAITPTAWESISLVRAQFAATLRDQLGETADLAALASSRRPWRTLTTDSSPRRARPPGTTGRSRDPPPASTTPPRRRTRAAERA